MNNITKISEDFPIKKVLIVDDEESLRILLMSTLKRAGFSSKEVESAELALELLATESFDLVISDIAMPGMDGVELLRRIKSSSPQLDVIIMTGYRSEYSYVDIMNAGASDYVSKPFNLNSILARINRIAREMKHLIDLKKTNQELCMAIERANVLARESKEASKAKTFFLASMSHEIRTPLNGIVGYSDMLMDTPLNDEQRSFLKHSRFSCDALLSVVNDILDFSKVEAGRLKLENIGFDPEVLCFDALDVVRTKVDESVVELQVSVADSVPGLVLGDPHRFRQVLLNLLSNAVKFTQKGMIKLGIDSKQTKLDHCCLTISVKDSGIGIANDQLNKIFKPFIQSEDDITNRYGGTGLGLAISKNIANKMQGDIWVESKKNEGSTFYFTSCFDVMENKQVNRVQPAQLKGKKVLLCTVSDNAYKILSHELSFCDADVSHVHLEDIDLFLKDNHSFDIGIVDFGSSDKKMIQGLIDKKVSTWTAKNGFDFLACSIPASGIADSFSKAGFKGFLSKPVPRRKLFDMVAYIIGIKNVEIEVEKDESQIVTSHLLNENKKHSVSILLVEDNPVNQRMTKLMLTKAGYKIDIAADGKEAVDKFTATPDAYDLVLMDINMPIMNGFEATQLIRDFELKNEVLGRIPILALTANVLDDFRQKCVDAQMDDFLTKPIKRDVVFTAIRKWVDHKRSQKNLQKSTIS